MSATTPDTETEVTAGIPFLQNMSAFAVSLIVHVLIVVVLLFIPYALEKAAPELALETIFNEERDAVEYDQELEEETEVSENLTFLSLIHI